MDTNNDGIKEKDLSLIEVNGHCYFIEIWLKVKHRRIKYLDIEKEAAIERNGLYLYSYTYLWIE